MDNSPLARLPPELRDAIYELVLTQEKPISLIVQSLLGGRTQRLQAQLDDCHGLAITMVCNAARHETSQLVFCCNTFTMTSRGTEHFYKAPGGLQRVRQRVTEELTDVVAAIGSKNAAVMKRIEISVGEIYHLDCLEAILRELRGIAPQYLPGVKVVAIGELRMSLGQARRRTLCSNKVPIDIDTPRLSLSSVLALFEQEMANTRSGGDRRLIIGIEPPLCVLRALAARFENA
ncbi:hypothetical protein LTR56_012726 [Elasticomyces elasticus]|nr:hypothetical protein LTR22_022989 [Elasticomyces elasticus]KAK3639003.1 hypothetical protein LTR56_012726 [Elasticomyces elasticus]KAK4918743.1 hypothetical protein LTR49_013530 [Elasticomyces elasticus]KAK5754428.1 hypothetical protein LTS12_015497 [Elasticomyces elasticus]